MTWGWHWASWSFLVQTPNHRLGEFWPARWMTREPIHIGILTPEVTVLGGDWLRAGRVHVHVCERECACVSCHQPHPGVPHHLLSHQASGPTYTLPPTLASGAVQPVRSVSTMWWQLAAPGPGSGHPLLSCALQGAWERTASGEQLGNLWCLRALGEKGPPAAPLGPDTTSVPATGSWLPLTVLFLPRMCRVWS